jgi:hypothetical protein
MYTDIKEIHPGAAHRLQSILRQSAAAAAQSSTSQSGPTVPPQAHLSLAGDGQDPHTNEQTSNSRPLPSSLMNSNAIISATRVPQDQTAVCQYLLLCVNTKKLRTLEHIDVSSFGNDQYLFEAIRDCYEHIRKAHDWKISMLIPAWIHIPNWLMSCVCDLTFSVPKTANFVRVRILVCILIHTYH